MHCHHGDKITAGKPLQKQVYRSFRHHRKDHGWKDGLESPGRSDSPDDQSLAGGRKGCGWFVTTLKCSLHLHGKVGSDECFGNDSFTSKIHWIAHHIEFRSWPTPGNWSICSNVNVRSAASPEGHWGNALLWWRLNCGLDGEIRDCAAKAVNYERAVHWIIVSDALEYYFLEMNTRLQVEHPITERYGCWSCERTDQHRKWSPADLKQEDLRQDGHAIQCRIYAEIDHTSCPPSTSYAYHRSLGWSKVRRVVYEGYEIRCIMILWSQLIPGEKPGPNHRPYAGL